MKRALTLFTAFAFLGVGSAASAGPALDAANAAFAKVDDYTSTISAHEVAGNNVQDRTYNFAFKRPSFVKSDIISGPGRGGGGVWIGGDSIRGHLGGLLSGIKRTVPLHDPQAVSLRGDTIDTGTVGAMLNDFKTVKGDVSEASGPDIDGATDAVTLKVADPSADKGVTREVLYLSRATHMPVRRELFSGDALVKSENITKMQTNVGLKASDFPF